MLPATLKYNIMKQEFKMTNKSIENENVLTKLNKKISKFNTATE